MKNKIKFCLTLSMAAGFILTAFMIYCHLNYVDPYSLLVSRSAAVSIFGILCAAAIIILLLLPKFTTGRCDVSAQVPNTSFLIFSSSLLGFLFAGYLVNFIIFPLRKYWISAELPSADVSSFGGILKGLYLAGVVLAVPCAVYFILVALQKNQGRSTALGILSMFPVLFMAMRLIYTFMATSAKVNIAGRRISIVAFCLCVLFLLCDAKLRVPEGGREKNKKAAARLSARFLATGYAAIAALFISQVSTTLLQAFWLMTPGDTYIMNGIYITMILYIAARILSVSPERVK